MPALHELPDKELREKLSTGELSDKKSHHCAGTSAKASPRTFSVFAQAACLVGSDTRRHWTSRYLFSQQRRFGGRIGRMTAWMRKEVFLCSPG
jgi:hypothetical protein